MSDCYDIDAAISTAGHPTDPLVPPGPRRVTEDERRRLMAVAIARQDAQESARLAAMDAERAAIACARAEREVLSAHDALGMMVDLATGEIRARGA